MRSKNPEHMQEIIRFVEGFYDRNSRTPSCREIAENTPLKRSAIHNYLVAMNERGMIEYNGQTILTPNIRAMQEKTRRIGIVGSVSCGIPTDARVRQEEYLNLPQAMAGGNDEMYILYANGDSMIEAGIDDGDMVLVRRQETAHVGDIIVAYVEGEGNTLKRFLRDEESIILHPENSHMKDIRVKECRIQGVAVWVFKKLN